MPTLHVYGPYSWSRPSGQPGMMPGDEHPWWVGEFLDGSVVFQASAHPTREFYSQKLEVVRLSTEYKQTGQAYMIFSVRNVGPTAVNSYRIFVSGSSL